MEDMILKPNLVLFQKDNEDGTEDTISINCFEIETIKPKKSVIKEGRKKSYIRLKDGMDVIVLGTVQELHSKILKS